MYVRDAHVWTGSLARLLRAKASRGSNGIEGHALGLDDTLAVLEGGPIYSNPRAPDHPLLSDRLGDDVPEA